MAKRLLSQPLGGHLIPSPGLLEAPVLDRMCSHFVLTLAARQGASLNVRRDFNGIVGLAGRHLVWPVSVLLRLRHSNAIWQASTAPASRIRIRNGIRNSLWSMGLRSVR